MRKPKPYKYIPLPPDFCPAVCTFDEACSYARHGRWKGFKKAKAGRWRTFKDGKNRNVEFASVLEDEARPKAESAGKPIESPVKQPPGRPPKVKSEQSASAAE